MFIEGFAVGLMVLGLLTILIGLGVCGFMLLIDHKTDDSIRSVRPTNSDGDDCNS
jgi:hypothetical protein